MGYISVIGAGSWGTALAYLLSDKGYEVTLWGHDRDLVEEMRKNRINSTYLPEIRLPDDLQITNDVAEALKEARYVIDAVPAQHTRAVFGEAVPHLIDEAIIVSVAKGIERGTLLTVSSILNELSDHTVAVLSGPSFAKEVIRKLPAAVTLATEEKNVGFVLQEIFNTNSFRVYTHDDITGVETGRRIEKCYRNRGGHLRQSRFWQQFKGIPHHKGSCRDDKTRYSHGSKRKDLFRSQRHRRPCAHMHKSPFEELHRGNQTRSGHETQRHSCPDEERCRRSSKRRIRISAVKEVQY